MSYFEKCFNDIIMNPAIEGGAKYVNDPKDPGGETKYGISRRSYPHLDIQNLSEDAAKLIYMHDYWAPLSLDAQSYPGALVTFDCAVNQGVGTARILRETSLTIPIFMAKRALKYSREPQEQLQRYGLGWMTRLFLVHQMALQTPSP